MIDRAVAWERADRYATMHQALEALAEAAARLDDVSMMPSVVRVGDPNGNRAALTQLGPDRALHLAREVGDALCTAAEERDGGLCWKRRFEWSERTAYSPDLYGGAAGVGLFLADLARQTGEGRYSDAARGAARWLAGPAWGRGRAQHGLHDGEAGVAYFFLRLAELLDAPGYVAAADLRLRRLRGASCHTVDLMYGTAGTLLGLLAMHAVTGDSKVLADACTAGDQLVAAALDAPEGDDGCYWEVVSATPGGPVIPYLGLLHGSAGIALALAHLGRVTGAKRFLVTATRAAELLLAQATLSATSIPGEEANEDEPLSWLTWPRHLGDTAPGLQAHCHGAGGLAQFFLYLDRLAPDPRYPKAAEVAARTVASQRGTETRSGICHGLSGTGHLMVDCYQAFGDPEWLVFAREAGDRLGEFRVQGRQGVYAMHGEDAVSPDLMLGYAGVGSLLLRLVEPVTASDLILGPLHDSLMKGEAHVRGDVATVPGARDCR